MALHECAGYLPSDFHGDAISSCMEISDGSLWVTNSEYASQVNYCPFCGFSTGVRVQVSRKPDRDTLDSRRRILEGKED